MDKKTTKSVISNISDILGIGDAKPSDGFFYREDVTHTVNVKEIEELIAKRKEWIPYNFYEYFLLPVVSNNPTKNMAIRWIYSTLAHACLDPQMKRNYYEKQFKHMILSRLDGVKNTEGAEKFYAIVLTRESCCSLCKRYDEKEIYNLDEILAELPPLVRTCPHDQSCHASVSVMSNFGYNARMRKRGGNL